MEIDQTTFDDLSIFHPESDATLFKKLNFSHTLAGKQWLHNFFLHPFGDLSKILDTQKILALLGEHLSDWPSSITNGTIMVIERFYDTPLDQLPQSHDPVNAYLYRWIHNSDYSLARYSLTHFADFIRGWHRILSLLDQDACPVLLRGYLRRASALVQHPTLQSLGERDSKKPFNPLEVARFGNYVQLQFKSAALELIDIYGRLDAWRSMATAQKEFQLGIPEFIPSFEPLMEAQGLYHLLLPAPTSYDIRMEQSSNFVFLTGANMAGKSTFIKAVGVAVYLAHLGMGVPAKHLRLTPFDGILTNINVMDNLAKGESYFFNEVKRIKDTLQKINGPRKWLVLIDELFKGTNVQDAMKCSSTVIRGLIKIHQSLFILSTHLYEIGEELRAFPNISFKYFETSVQGDQLRFSYLLKDGISNDRLGYLILKKEKVVELLDQL